MKHNITFNTRKFLEDSNIDHTDTGQKATKNRIQVHCPFCVGSKNFHLGIHVSNAYANCWRCGPHSMLETIRELLHVSWREAYKIMDEYQDTSNIKTSITSARITGNKLIFKGLLEPLKKIHRDYLIHERQFNPDELTSTWGIQSIGPIGDFKHRIYIPIYYRGVIVSYQCRSIVKGDHIIRYLTCKPEHETVFHKSILYGLDYVASDKVLVVEGVTDVWRMGPGTVATFGIEYMKEQVYQLSKFKEIFILFDPEPTAQKQAEKLANELSFMKGCTPYIIDIKNTGASDPGTLEQKIADQMMLDIMRGTL
jgi:hypothetical protein